jgi:hypothetical protein
MRITLPRPAVELYRFASAIDEPPPCETNDTTAIILELKTKGRRKKEPIRTVHAVATNRTHLCHYWWDLPKGEDLPLYDDEPFRICANACHELLKASDAKSTLYLRFDEETAFFMLENDDEDLYIDVSPTYPDMAIIDWRSLIPNEVGSTSGFLILGPELKIFLDYMKICDAGKVFAVCPTTEVGPVKFRSAPGAPTFNSHPGDVEYLVMPMMANS